MQLKAIFFTLAASLLAQTASATIITFEESPQISGATPSTQGDVISGGYSFDSSTNHTHFVNNFSGGDSGSTFFGADDFSGSTYVSMTQVGGNNFSLVSLDLGNWFEKSTNIMLTGNYSGGGSISTNIALGAFATYNLGWNNLTSLVFNSTAGSGDQYWGVDNINVTNVPEPSSIALLTAGLFGLGMARRRKNTQP